MNYSDLFAKTEELFAPAKALSELTLASTEKLVEINLTAAKANAEVVLGAWKAALDVKDMDSAKAYFEAQRSVAEASVKRAQSDAQAIAEVSKGYVADVQQISKDSMEKVAKLAA
ncbi:MAG: phasin family protein [Gammaproteobacteria bacterium]